MNARHKQLAVLAAVLSAGVAHAAPARLDILHDSSIRVRGATYEARIDTIGNMYSLVVSGVEIMDTSKKFRGAAFPHKKGAEDIDVAGSRVTARRGSVSVTYSFDEDGYDVTTDGGTVEPHIKGVTVLVCKGGNTADGKRPTPDVRKVMFGTAAISLSDSFHCMFGRLVPSRLCGRGGKRTDRYSYRVDCGVKSAAHELLTTPELHGRGQNRWKVPRFKGGTPPVFELSTGNLGGEAVTCQVRFVVDDHYAKPRKIDTSTVTLELAPHGKTSTSYEASKVTEPGFYWITAQLVHGGQVRKSTRLGFIYDGEDYKPTLTRPADFRRFWDVKLRDLRRVPFGDRLTEAPSKGNATYRHYDLELTVAPGKRIKTFLRVPRAPGTYDAEVVSNWGSTPEKKVLQGLAKMEKQSAGAGLWQRGGVRIRVGAPQPGDSRYRRWNGLHDSNMLDSYMHTVRMIDYLRARDDVREIFLFGASRSGAIMLANAGLDPTKIASVNVHVPTSCGLSWTDKIYRGWGHTPDPAIAAYFDPVNFAPDVTCAILTDGGIDDNLAPPPGILAYANHATRSPFVRCSIERGGHGYFSNSARKGHEKELNEYIDSRR